MPKQPQITYSIITIDAEGILFSRWDTEQNTPRLITLTHYVTEMTFLAYGYINNLPRLVEIVKNLIAGTANTEACLILLGLDHSHEQLIFTPPEQNINPHNHDDALLHTQQYLFTTKHGTNALLHTTMHAALLVQLQLLADTTNLLLHFVSTFSYACLYAYARLQSHDHTEATLYQDLQKAEYTYSNLCKPAQLLPCVKNATDLCNLTSIAPKHITATIATILFLSEHAAHDHQKHTST